MSKYPRPRVFGFPTCEGLIRGSNLIDEGHHDGAITTFYFIFVAAVGLRTTER